MKKVLSVKSAVCVGAITLLTSTVNPINVSATSLCTETGLAGIALSLEQYTQSADDGAETNPLKRTNSASRELSVTI